ncbi:MAG: acetamidase/formamidase family protein [Nocardioides alkalitolerans]
MASRFRFPDAPLDAGVGPVRAATYLPSTPDHLLWGRLPCRTDAPVLRVDPGTEVTVDTLSHEGVLADQGRDPRAFFASYGVDGEQVLADAVALAASDRAHTPGPDGPHVVTGPIAVTGAEPGDLLAVTIVETLPRVPYGVVSNRHARGALPGEYPLGGLPVVSAFAALAEHPDPATGRIASYGEIPLTRAGYDAPGAPRARFPLAPFLGIIGVAVDDDVRPHSVPPGAHGGNLDINLLTEGATLYLPVQVADALVHVGDPHFAQGDGEVALTAMEASLRATVRLDVVPREEAVARFGELASPLAETREHLVPTGLDEDLDVAVQNCVRAAIGLLGARYGMEPAQAYAYLSAATDFDISQVVDVVKGVHARIRTADFAHLGEGAARNRPGTP